MARLLQTRNGIPLNKAFTFTKNSEQITSKIGITFCFDCLPIYVNYVNYVKI